METSSNDNEPTTNLDELEETLNKYYNLKSSYETKKTEKKKEIKKLGLSKKCKGLESEKYLSGVFPVPPVCCVARNLLLAASPIAIGVLSLINLEDPIKDETPKEITANISILLDVNVGVILQQNIYIYKY